MKLSSIAIDDEPLGLALLADDLRQIPTIDLVGTFTRPFDALATLQAGRIDLLFLDIQLPTLLGTDFLRALSQPPMVIFTTAYEQYALEGYELNAVDYLLKPIRFERLLKACTKACDWHARGQKGSLSADTFFFVKKEYKEVKLYHHDVRYVEGLKDYVKIYLTSQPGRPVLTRLNLKGMEALLPPDQFCRVHQSYIVSLRRITAFHRSQVLIGGTTLPVGERYAEQFLARYQAG